MGQTDADARPFIALIAWLRELNGAFDAADRGYHDHARRVHADGVAGVRALWDAHPALADVLPDLPATLAASGPYDDWSELITRSQAHIASLRAVDP